MDHPSDKSLTVLPQPALLPSSGELQTMKELAQNFHEARGKLFPATIDSPAMLFGIIEAGREVGLAPMAAIRHVFVVNGRTDYSAQAMQAIVRARDPSADFIYHVETAEHCKIELHRAGKTPKISDYTIDQVPTAIKGKGPWKDYQEDMLRWFTLKRLCRTGASDLLNVTTAGMSMADVETQYDEIDAPAAVASDENTVDGTALDVTNEGDVEEWTADPRDKALVTPQGIIDGPGLQALCQEKGVRASDMAAIIGSEPDGASLRATIDWLGEWLRGESGRSLVQLINDATEAKNAEAEKEPVVAERRR